MHTAFSFDRDFAKSGGGSPFLDAGRRGPVPQAEHQRLVEEAREAGRLAGVEEGKQLQSDEEKLQIAQAMQNLAARLEMAAIEMARVEEQARSEAIAFARLFARKLAGRMMEVIPVQAVEATARAIFSDLRGSPHVAVRVAPALVDACKTRIGALMRENGIEAKLFVFPDPDIPAGDCRIEWADGGIVRERAKLETMLDQAVNALFPDCE